MRDTTERSEGVVAGTASLVGTDPDKIIFMVELLLNDQSEYDKMAKAVNPYADGKASEIIYNFILHQL